MVVDNSAEVRNNFILRIHGEANRYVLLYNPKNYALRRTSTIEQPDFLKPTGPVWCA